MSEIIEKVCSNCANYSQHYTIAYENTLISTNCGCCMKKNPNSQNLQRFSPTTKGCQFWEPLISEKADKYKSIKKALKSIIHRLSDIEMILKNDLDDNNLNDE